ncbi:DHA2 family efflux MFS transporter permease subunit [Solicola gregarius]|uniref:DHA2 family efflux MFS transporter permease subunit n=1 Tax=Solicola gregarius TaxID=2908642 RepID=A0AA46TF25_9ACTN|nr:DHA2 family efflux MFS transporter permease subunit [Solicola gregarius]UYM04008.1 DHA2 family efflux MFS transporter permease subunit [Solicola gregarius]
MQESYPRRWWALGALAIALLTFGLDLTVMNVAMPTLAVELDASTSQLQWFSNAYTLVLAAALLPAGLLGDKLGPRRWLLTGLALFGVASIACAYADSAAQLIAARALLGVGAALMVPLSASMLTRMFQGAERGRAIAIWATAMSLGIPLGPVVGGWLLDNFWWGSVFLINVPLVVVGLVALALWLPSIQGERGTRLDIPGIALSSAGLVALTYGLVEAGDDGWTSTGALVPVTAGLALLIAFAWWQRTTAHPLVDLALFRSPGFLWGSTLATLATFTMMGAMFVLPQYFSAVNGTDAMQTGLRLLPMIGGLLVGVQVADRLRPAFGAKVVVGSGFVLTTIALLIGSTTEVGTGVTFTLTWLAILGVGFGATMAPSMDIALGALDQRKSGVGSAVTQAMRQVAGTFGVAMLGAVLNATYRSNVDVGGLPVDAATATKDSAEAGVRVADATGSDALLDSIHHAFVDGMSAMLWVCAGVGVVGAVLAVSLLPKQADDIEQREEATIDA